MMKVQTLNNIAAVGLARFTSEKYEVGTEMNNPDVILVRSAKMHEMTIGDNLKAVGRAGAGVNNIPLDKMSDCGVVVFNAPGANANAVKELVISAMLLSSRNICQAWQYVNTLGLDNLKANVEVGKKNYAGSELPNRTLGVVGLGSIGVKIANAALDLGMKVVGYDPNISIKNAWKLSSGVEQASSIDALCAQSDFITFHVPLVAGTKNLLNAKRMAMLPEGATVMNFARDGIVDETALESALDSEHIKYYVTDFPIDILKNHERVIALPHLGASTTEAEENCAVMVADQVRNYLEYGNIVNSVNFPEVVMADAGRRRLSIAHKNVPNMVGQISTVLADGDMNIADMLNQSRNTMAYTLIGIEGEIKDAVIENLAQIEGILSVRICGAL